MDLYNRLFLYICFLFRFRKDCTGDGDFLSTKFIKQTAEYCRQKIVVIVSCYYKNQSSFIGLNFKTRTSTVKKGKQARLKATDPKLFFDRIK